MSNIEEEFSFMETTTCPPCATSVMAVIKIIQDTSKKCIPAEWPAQDILVRFGMSLALMILFLFIIGLSLTKVLSECRKKRKNNLNSSDASGRCADACIDMGNNLQNVSNIYNQETSFSTKNRSKSIQNFNT